MLFLSTSEALLWPQLRKLEPGQRMRLRRGVVIGRARDGRAYLDGAFRMLVTGPSAEPCGPWCRLGSSAEASTQENDSQDARAS
ncbi:hypothetical protein [Crystallibacter degradans]|uniref:hypothetical protein n=1 Tax=Crystallibacter degradans TaxID=2726743 RepID=UPI001473ED15|nr:hypothetical protein [Arthrobacter sp. SF27]NMR30582.1 hypothetical protein [Arthrobacter sp. SF27]